MQICFPVAFQGGTVSLSSPLELVVLIGFSYPCRTCSHSQIFIGFFNLIGFVASSFTDTAPHFIENLTLRNMAAKSI